MLERVAVAVMLLSACGGGESAEERICGAANGCGALASANVDACVTTLETIDAERALAECANCLETNTCAEIAGGACGPSCSAFSSVFDAGLTLDPNKRLSDLTQAEAEALCTYSVDQAGGAGASETCSGNLTVTTNSVAECTSSLLAFTCTVTVGQFQACFDAVDSPCDPFMTPACEPIFNCAR